MQSRALKENNIEIKLTTNKLYIALDGFKSSNFSFTFSCAALCRLRDFTFDLKMFNSADMVFSLDSLFYEKPDMRQR